jgi:hypothetical protein
MAWPLSGRTNEMSEGVALRHSFSVEAFAWRNAKNMRECKRAQRRYAMVWWRVGVKIEEHWPLWMPRHGKQQRWSEVVVNEVNNPNMNHIKFEILNTKY